MAERVERQGTKRDEAESKAIGEQTRGALALERSRAVQSRVETEQSRTKCKSAQCSSERIYGNRRETPYMLVETKRCKRANG